MVALPILKSTFIIFREKACLAKTCVFCLGLFVSNGECQFLRANEKRKMFHGHKKNLRLISWIVLIN